MAYCGELHESEGAAWSRLPIVSLLNFAFLSKNSKSAYFKANPVTLAESDYHLTEKSILQQQNYGIIREFAKENKNVSGMDVKIVNQRSISSEAHVNGTSQQKSRYWL